MRRLRVYGSSWAAQRCGDSSGALPGLQRWQSRESRLRSCTAHRIQTGPVPSRWCIETTCWRSSRARTDSRRCSRWWSSAGYVGSHAKRDLPAVSSPTLERAHQSSHLTDRLPCSPLLSCWHMLNIGWGGRAVGAAVERQQWDVGVVKCMGCQVVGGRFAGSADVER